MNKTLQPYEISVMKTALLHLILCKTYSNNAIAVFFQMVKDTNYIRGIKAFSPIPCGIKNVKHDETEGIWITLIFPNFSSHSNL